MERKSRDFVVLILFYVNLAVYAGGTLYWQFFGHSTDLPTATYGQLSSYDPLIQKYSQRHGLDWRFVSSIIATESAFDSNAVSSAGATGLMQVLPMVADIHGHADLTNPEENIRIGTQHFKKYFRVLQGETLDDTLKINLAAYNAGIAHIRDAKKLAVYLKMNPRKWESIEKTLPLLESDEFHPLVEHGYCQGNSVVSYVHKVFQKYQYYRHIHPDFPVEIKEL